MGLLTVKNLTSHYHDVKTAMVYNTYSKDETEKLVNNFKQNKTNKDNKTFVIKFDGDVQAKEVDLLKKSLCYFIHSQ